MQADGFLNAPPVGEFDEDVAALPAEDTGIILFLIVVYS